MPNISGAIGRVFMKADSAPYVNGAFGDLSGVSDGHYSGDHDNIGIYSFNFYASRSNSIYGASKHVTPENFTILIWRRKF